MDVGEAEDGGGEEHRSRQEGQGQAVGDGVDAFAPLTAFVFLEVDADLAVFYDVQQVGQLGGDLQGFGGGHVDQPGVVAEFVFQVQFFPDALGHVDGQDLDQVDVGGTGFQSSFHGHHAPAQHCDV